MDNLKKYQRSKIMRGNKSTNTAPEIIVRKVLFKNGMRYRLHNNKLEGKPDIFLKKYRCVIFINGCFWHHHKCSLANMPRSNRIFWKKKFQTNARRDRKNVKKLVGLDWRVITVWECALRGKEKMSEENFSRLIIKNITRSTGKNLSIP